MIRSFILSMLIITIITLHCPHHIAAARPDATHTFRIIVKASDESRYDSVTTVRSSDWDKMYQHMKTADSESLIPVTDALLVSEGDGGKTSYWIDHQGFLYEQASSRKLIPPDVMRNQLVRHVERLRSEHYGILLPWDEVDPIFPRKDMFTVTDIETGLSFQVQRRAGSFHADVQPLTKHDTRIMKQIYNGRWSWKRRAIMVAHQIDFFTGQKYAASMHGMPHGGDGIPGNLFSGHFCIHFLNSRTHGSGHVDFDHQLMIYKAAGKLGQLYESITPKELVHSFFSALNQQDPVLLNWCFAYYNHPQLDFYREEMKRIASVHMGPSSIEPKLRTQSLVHELTVQVEMYRREEGRVRQVFTFLISRSSFHSPWKIEHISLVS